MQDKRKLAWQIALGALVGVAVLQLTKPDDDKKAKQGEQVLASEPAKPVRYGGLEFTPCSLPSAGRNGSIDARCARMKVPEDHADPKGRQIELAIAWLPAKGEAEPDPVFMIAGGPGQSALQSYAMVSAAFADVNRSRHVLLLDARGTGGSTPLSCRDTQGRNAITEDSTDEAAMLREATAFAERCVKALGAKHDLRHYSTVDHIQDLDAVRVAVGAAQVNLVGISYGTRVAQQYAKRYPAQTRSLVLDSIAPNALVLGSEHARNLENALDTHFQRCAAVPACAKQLKAPREALREIRARLESGAVGMVDVRDPRSGEWTQVKPQFGHLSMLLRLYSYSPDFASAMPYVLHEASQGRYEAMMAQSAMITSDLTEQIYHGMQLSVSCSEDAADLKADPRDEDSVMGNGLVTLLQAQCAVWPHKPRPQDSRVPLTGATPVLLISGEFDPVTPPRYGDAVLHALSDLSDPKSTLTPGLPNARHLVLKGQGHSVLGIGCMPKLFAQFIETKDAKALDATCLDRLQAAPPFAGVYGWEP